MATVEEYVRQRQGPTEPQIEWTARDVEGVYKETERLARQAFDGDRRAAEALQRTAYALFLARYRNPWGDGTCDVVDPVIAAFLCVYASAWDRADRERYRVTLREVPAAQEFPGWATELVQAHKSNVQHPLFDFLAEHASHAQLREFFRQETPFDVHFVDILIALAPGIYGRPKLEIAHNFWDEMGSGKADRVHRSMRLAMMARLGLSEDEYVANASDFILEEIELANAYFLGATMSSRALQLIGMLLATESMVPGRLQRQIDGWRRVGLDDAAMEYLIEHTTVDVGHAEDWMRDVVMPIVEEHPAAAKEIALGALRRLDVAGRICDAMITHLKKPEFSVAE